MPAAQQKRSVPKPSRRALAGKSVSATMQRVHRPPETTVTAKDDKALHEEQQISRVEMLMLKGVVRPDIIGAMLDLGTQHVQKLQDRVHARWEITGGGRTIARFRGEALTRLDLLEQEAWSTYGSLDNRKDPSVRDRVKVLGLIASLQDQRSALLGLSPKVIERIGLLPDHSAEVLARFAAQKDLAVMATRLTQILAERRAALDGETIDHDEVVAETP